jgi:hypothetical protein
VRAGLSGELIDRVGAFRGRLAARRAVGSARGEDVVHAPPASLKPALRLLARDCDSVLDVGTGLMDSLAESPCKVRLGLDAHRPYLERRSVEDAVPINASALEIDRIFVPGAVDLVTMIDVIEHFTPDDAAELLRKAGAVARRRVVLFTPRGEFPQDGFDAFGLGGEELQRHRSSWEPEDFTGLGMKVMVLDDFHGPWNASFVEAFGDSAEPRDALLAWRDC